MLRHFAPVLLLATACTEQAAPVASGFDWQGHRGARGEMPENSVPAFLYALDHGVKTLEMDVVITGDRKVVVSHEPFMSHEICFDPAGNIISEKQEKSYNIFHMTYSEVLFFNCGSKTHPRFPEQEKTDVSKPLLSTVIKAAEKHAAENGREAPFFNIEIKSRPEWEGEFHPQFSMYTDEVMKVVDQSGAADRIIIQSFDKRVLQYMHENYGNIPVALLVEQKLSPEAQIDSLEFTPDIYSCHHTLVDEQLVRMCREKNMKLIPWTVNETDEMKRLIQMGVDGIITDFPSRAAKLSTLRKES